MTPPTLAEATRVFLRIGLLSFGGPAAQIALMHRELVEDRDWLDEPTFLRALSFCMLLPGPEAMQLATYAGWRLHGVRGGLIAGLLFVLPGASVILALAMVYATFGAAPHVTALMLGVKATVIAIVVEALLRVGRRALKTTAHRAIALLAFVALAGFALPFPVVIGLAAIWGLVTRRGPSATAPLPPLGPTLRTVALWLAIWLLPLAALWLVERGILAQIGLYFAQLAVLTFGGAYAVLAWMAQSVVADYGWLDPAMMLDALGLAETTPGPLILVTEFVGFLAAAGQGGIWLGVAGAGVTLWMTFAPCFLWIFAGAPWLEHLTGRPRLEGALAAITAAVVGVIGNLSLWFALHVFFGQVETVGFGPLRVSAPIFSSFDPLAAGLALLAGVMLLRLHLGLGWVLPICAGLSLALSLA